MIRAYVNSNTPDNAKEAIIEYGRIGNTLIPRHSAMLPIKALAQCLAGKKLDADETMKTRDTRKGE